MTPVDELRAAATKLRTLAEAAMPGPWQLQYPSAPSTTICSTATGSRVVASAGGVPPNFWPSLPDAEYIAAVHPLVGLALADVLDRFTSVWAEVGGPELGHDHPMVALARLILGGGS